MIRGTDFLLLNEAERKMKRGEALSPEEQRIFDTYGDLLPKPKLCGYNGCTNELEPRVDGERDKIKGVEVCRSCYDRAMDELVGQYPVCPPRLRRPLT